MQKDCYAAYIFGFTQSAIGHQQVWVGGKVFGCSLQNRIFVVEAMTDFLDSCRTGTDRPDD